MRYRPKNGPFTFTVSREPVKDTVLSYAGVRDPNGAGTFGGVMATGGSIRGNWGGATSGIYVSGGYQELQGKQVADNTRSDGNVGTYWRVLERPEGTLTVGMNLTGMHYDKNLRFFSWGQGGYFSPQSYFLFNAPVRWIGKWQRLEYLVAGSLGSQYFEEDSTPVFPLTPTRQFYSGQAKTSANYSLELRAGYRLAPNWYLGGYVTANNTQNYTSQAVGFNVRYLVCRRPRFHRTITWTRFRIGAGFHLSACSDQLSPREMNLVAPSAHRSAEGAHPTEITPRRTPQL